MRRLQLNMTFACILSLAAPALAASVTSTDYLIDVQPVASGLNHPWSMAWLPGKPGHWLVSERNGRLLLIDSQGKITRIEGAPDAMKKGQGGLLGVALSPDFASSGEIFVAFAEADKSNGNLASTAVAKGKLVANRLIALETIFSASPRFAGTHHFGGRLAVQDDCLWLTLGDRGERSSAQDLNSHNGSVLRITFDGLPCPGNPQWQDAGARPEIYTYGHRNIQGLAVTPTGEIWVHEHGPQGGDELNLIAKGSNYGWPVITYGKNYGSGTDIGEGSHKEGMQQPVHYWVPSIAPSGLSSYQGKLFEKWHGNLLLGSLKFGLLVRLELRDGKVVAQEQLLNNQFGRIRDVAVGPDDAIYLLTDSNDGQLLRLTPAPAPAKDQIKPSKATTN
ncbi:PQQ-dependent sugar dehydrogenase [Shewanella sp. GXUN23E]|uniref:PQQ-dependent sugar dehydrogenase n=1 Tax=Shewanella sp. GXUN23E TaxID=3422498 RepID=UPI003D7E645F